MTTIEQMSKQYRLLTDWYISVLEGIKTELSHSNIWHLYRSNAPSAELQCF